MLSLRKSSISVIVTIALVAGTTLLLGMFGVFYYDTLSKQAWTNLRNEVSVETDQLALSLALPVWNIDREQIDKMVENTMKHRDIYGVEVNAAGSLHARVRNADWGIEKSAKVDPMTGGVTAEGVITFHGETIGSIKVFAAPKFIEQELQSTLISGIAAILLLDLLLVLILSLLLWRIVLKPLKAIERYAAAVSSGSRDTVAAGLGPFRGELENLKSSIEAMVNTLRISMDQLRLLAARIENVREEERKSISHEVHDGLGQVLTALKMDFMALKHTWKPAEKNHSAPLDAMITMIDNAIVIVQDVSAQLRPGMLDYLGLLAAAEWQTEDFQKHSGITCSLQLPDHEIEIDDERSTVLFRILQETLTNVARHAQAKHVTVSLVDSEHGIVMTILDDGIGISDEQVRSPKALGLLGIRERLHPFKGSCSIQRGAGGGTEVRVQLPLRSS
jgi:signal transduction histidine kinase